MQPLPDRLPLVIGVTGHRDLRDEDVPRLEREVAAIIGGLRRDYLGGEAETPIVVLSSLAEGADRLVARVALAQGAWLVAPMPMPIDEYRRDFEPGLTPGNAAEFDALLAQAIATPVIPFLPGNSLAAVREDSAKRSEQYRAVGLFIVRHASILIALWDGADGKMSAGGTAEVVSFKRHGIPLAVSGSARVSLDASEVGPVIHVVTPRRKDGSAASDVSVRPWGPGVIRHYGGGLLRRALRSAGTFIANVLGREDTDGRSRLSADERRELDAWETFEALTTLTVQFNREAAALGAPSQQHPIDTSLDAMFAGAQPLGIDADAAKRCAMERAPRWCRMYAVADTLARGRHQEFRRDWIYVYAFALLAFLCFALFSHAGVLSTLFLVLYVAGFVGIFIVVLRGQIGRHQERFLDYRALAEALRVASFWRIVGIGSAQFDTSGAIANAYPIRQASELAWVKDALRTLELLNGREQLGVHALDAAGHAVARHYWVLGQSEFFRERGIRLHRQADVLSAQGIVLTVLAPFLIVPVVLAFTSSAATSFEAALRTALLILSGLLPGIASIMNEYSERLALSAQARQYDRMRIVFERASELLPETIDERTAPLAQEVYLELGQEAMRENAEWTAIYRQRPIQPPR